MKHAPFFEINEPATKRYLNVRHVEQIVAFGDEREQVRVVMQDGTEYRPKESYQELLARLDYAYRED